MFGRKYGFETKYIIRYNKREEEQNGKGLTWILVDKGLAKFVPGEFGLSIRVPPRGSLTITAGRVPAATAAAASIPVACGPIPPEVVENG